MVAEFTLQDVATHERMSADLWYTHYQAQSHARWYRASIEILTGWDDYNVLPVFFSDHALVSFIIVEANRKTSFEWALWKFNNSRLTDDVFNETVNNLIRRIHGVSDSAGKNLEWFKSEIKLKAIELSSTLAYWKKAEEKLLLADLSILCKLECDSPG